MKSPNVRRTLVLAGALAALLLSSHALADKKKILYWRSPMDPTYISKEPGKDTMGMDLVPVYEGEEQAGPAGTVRIDPITIQNIGVKTAVIRRQELRREIRTVGRITYDETHVRSISPKIGGWVERQYVNFTGQVVERGAPLLEIYSPELVSTQEEYLLALRYKSRLLHSDVADAVSGSNSLVRAAETRLRYWEITPAQIRALRERGHLTRTMVLHAPFKGIILAKHVLEGGYVRSGERLYQIADLSTVWVYADVYEYEVPWLQAGAEATMTLAYHPGVTYRGRIVYVYPYLQNETRTLQVRMEFPNTADFDLKPDMWADVTLRSKGHEGLAVPVQAVIRTGKRDVVLVALEGGRFEPRDVKLGAEAGENFEVLSGLHAGEQVVTSAQFLINSESSLQAAISKMLEQKPAPSTPAASKPAHGKAGHGKPAHGKAGHGKPAHGEAGHGKPAHGEAGHGE